MAADEWATSFRPIAADGTAVPADRLPLIRALTDRRPAHTDFWIEGLDRVRRHLSVTALPLDSQSGRLLGAVAFFWEAEP